MDNKDREAKPYSYEPAPQAAPVLPKRQRASNPTLVGYGLAFGVPIVGVSIPILMGKALSGEARNAYLDTLGMKADLHTKKLVERMKAINDLK